MQTGFFLLPEIVVLVLVLLLLVVDAARIGSRQVLRDVVESVGFHLSWIGFAIAALSALYVASTGSSHLGGDSVKLLSIDTLSQNIKAIIAVFAALMIVLARPFTQAFDYRRIEIYMLMGLASLGAMVMSSANHFLMMYLGLELLALSTCALIAVRRDQLISIEAAMKYFVLSALASGMLLYGISMLYGAAGGLSFDQVAAYAHSAQFNPMFFVFGLVFVLAGVAFKLGVVPFHGWVPDVYQGAPSSTVVFLSTVPKIALVVVLSRLLSQAFVNQLEVVSSLLMYLAVASLIVGNTAALVQTTFKRMLAYSAIAQLGFVLLAVVADIALVLSGGQTQLLLSSALFYVLTYSFNSLLAFAILFFVSTKHKEIELISDLNGLNRRSPWLAFCLMLVMLSMAGIPPMIGFFAKFYVVAILIKQGLVYLGVFAVLMSVVATFYYLRVIKAMYFEPSSQGKLIVKQRGTLVLYVLLGLGLLVLSLVPQVLFNAISIFLQK